MTWYSQTMQQSYIVFHIIFQIKEPLWAPSHTPRPNIHTKRHNSEKKNLWINAHLHSIFIIYNVSWNSVVWGFTGVVITRPRLTGLVNIIKHNTGRKYCMGVITLASYLLVKSKNCNWGRIKIFYTVKQCKEDNSYLSFNTLTVDKF